jgi:hypothetical protein
VTVIGLMSELIALVRLIRTLSVGDLQDRLPQAAMSRRVSRAERRRVLGGYARRVGRIIHRALSSFDRRSRLRFRRRGQGVLIVGGTSARRSTSRPLVEN